MMSAQKTPGSETMKTAASSRTPHLLGLYVNLCIFSTWAPLRGARDTLKPMPPAN